MIVLEKLCLQLIMYNLFKYDLGSFVPHLWTTAKTFVYE